MKITEVNKTIKEAVDANGGYCPCLVEKSPDTLCMCREFRDSIVLLAKGDTVTCRCGRYKATNEHV